MAVAHRLAQAQGFRDAGRHDLADEAEARMVHDAAHGAMNGMVRGTAVAMTQAVLGANPLTAGIGLVAPDAVMLLTKRDQLTEEQDNKKATEVVAKGAIAERFSQTWHTRIPLQRGEREGKRGPDDPQKACSVLRTSG